MDYIKQVDEILNKISNSCLYTQERQDQKKEIERIIQTLETTLNSIKDKLRAANFAEEPLQPPPGLSPEKLAGRNNDIIYNAEMNQYELTIGNLQLRGNIGNIYDKKLLLNDRIKAHQVIKCYNKNRCFNILHQEYCKFWHDPADLIVLRNNGIISNEFYLNTIKYTRNFSNTSFIYNPGPSTNKHVRLIGSKNSLENDIKLVKASCDHQYSVENMKAQVMHDILVLQQLTTP